MSKLSNAYKHGKSRTPVYNSWYGMVQRCTNPKRSDYEYYGGRGINVCERWLSFENFLSDMGDRPYGMTLDRINPDGDYCKDNCKWSTKSEQSSNQRERKHTGKTSQYKGVCWDKKNKKWLATVYSGGKPCYRGSFDTEIEAHEAYEAHKHLKYALKLN